MKSILLPLLLIATGSRSLAYTRNPEFHRAAPPNGDWALYNRRTDPRQEQDFSALRQERMMV